MLLQSDPSTASPENDGSYVAVLGLATIAASLWAADIRYVGLRHEGSDRQATFTAGGLFASAVVLVLGIFDVEFGSSVRSSGSSASRRGSPGSVVRLVCGPVRQRRSAVTLGTSYSIAIVTATLLATQTQ